MPKPKVFVSSAYGDEKSRNLIEALSGVLRTAGVGVWHDKTELTVGERWNEQLEKALEDCQTFVFLLSPRALNSQWTNFEIGVAASRAGRSPYVRIIPVLIGGAHWEAVPEFLRKRVGFDANKASEDEVAAEVARAVLSGGTKMAKLAFQGDGLALSSNGLNTVADTMGVQAPEIWTVLAVETSGCGYLSDRRPTILFERHIFHRLTDGQYDDGDISDPEPGGYGPRGTHQYDRLSGAISKDLNAGLQSASWGIGQVMGMNYAIAGFQNVEDMVAAMCASEDNQLLALANFLRNEKLDLALQAHDWESLALGYNGKNYKANQYDSKLKAAFQNYSAGNLPDLDVRGAQLYLTYLGYKPGEIDGVVGPRTLSALAAFQSDHGLGSSNTIDANCVAQISAALTAALAVNV